MKLEIGFRNQNKKGEWFEVVENAIGNYLVKFDCGLTRKVGSKRRILNGNVSSRKCREPLKVEIGQRYGKLTVIGLDDPVNPTLLCECGNKYSTPRYGLINNLKTSCGCSPMKPATDAYWEDFNNWMKDWNPTTHKPSVKKLPLFALKKGGSKIIKIVGFTYVDTEFYEYWKQFPFKKCGYAQLANNSYIYDKVIGFGRNLKYSYSLHHLVRGHTNFGEYVVDHINGCKLDNRFKNLRTATIQQNTQNGRKLSTRETSSIYKGVCFVPARVGYSKKRKDKPWKAYITWDNGKHSIQRYYETEIEAALKYNELALEIFGEFAKLNIIKAP